MQQESSIGIGVHGNFTVTESAGPIQRISKVGGVDAILLTPSHGQSACVIACASAKLLIKIDKQFGHLFLR
jgi:hypothetical protein